jgi:spermidine synthase
MLGRRKREGKTADRRYRGALVFEDHDEMGLMEVVDDLEHRSLHFGSREKQSAMSLASHHQLVLSYTQAMMAGLLFVDTPRSVLNVGLGGGSIPKFLLHHYPDCNVDVVEIREKVVDLAYDYFHLPRDPRLNIFISDIKEYFRTIRSKVYDIIVLDVYDKEGMSDSIRGFSFMSACQSRLTENGVLIVNLWSEPEQIYKKMVYNIFKSFKSQALILPVADRSNHIAIGINQPVRTFQDQILRKKSHLLEQEFQIDMPDLFTRLCSRNKRLLMVPPQ